MHSAFRRFPIYRFRLEHLSFRSRPWRRIRRPRLSRPALLIALAVIAGTEAQAQSLPALPEETSAPDSQTRTDGSRDAGPAQLPRITLAAQRDTIIAGLESLLLEATREAPFDAAVPLTVTLVQDRNWLSQTSHEILLDAGATTGSLAVGTALSSSVTASGNVTATIGSVAGYDTDDASATVHVISQEGPAVTASLTHGSYRFDEDGVDTRLGVTARMAAGVPRGASVVLSLADEGGSESRPELTASSGVDYWSFSVRPSLRERDFALEDGRWVARQRIPVTLVDDDVREGRESFRVHLRHVPGRADEVQLLNPDATACSGADDCRYMVFIDDDEDVPALDLSVSDEEISEEEEGSSTATVSITNGKTFAADQAVSFAFAGTATRDTDYRVTPADVDGEAPGHQATLPAGSISVGVALTAIDDEVEDSNEEIEVSAAHEGEAIGSPRTIRILNQEMLPKITLTASRDTLIAGLEAVVLSATREAPLDAPLTLTLRVAQDQNWLSRTSFQLSFAAQGSRASLNLLRSLFSTEVAESGSITATIDSVSGYDTGDASATVYVVSQEGPAIKLSFADASYRFAEDESNPSVALVARAAAGMPRGASFQFSLSTRSGTASSPGDYEVLTRQITVSEADFTLAGGVWQARSAVSLTLVDDDVFEGTESFSFLLERSAGLSSEVQISDLQGAPCPDDCTIPAEISDDEDVPEFRLSVSEEEIHEEGETSSAATVSITNGKTFAYHQVVMLRLSGDAIPGHDYTIAPAYGGPDAAAHEVVLRPDSSSFAVTLTAIDDDREEGDEMIRISVTHGGSAVGSETIRLVDRFPGPRVQITFEGVRPPRDEYAAGVATGPFTARFTFSERVQGFEEEDIRWSTHSLTTVDTTNIGVLVWDYAVIREGLEYTARMMPDQDGRVWIGVDPGAARSVATGDGNQLGASSLWVELPPNRLMVAPTELTIDEGDENGASFIVVPTSAPTGDVTVMVTGMDGTDLEVDWSTWTFGLPYWNGGWGVTVTAAHDADTADERVGLWVKASGGGYDGRGADLRVTIRDDDGASADRSGDPRPRQDGLEEALKLLVDVTPEVAAAALLGGAKLSDAQLRALDEVGNGNGRYDLGDMLSWAARCRRAERSNRTRRRRSSARLRNGRSGGGGPRNSGPRRRGRGPRGRTWTALAFLGAVTLGWGCDHRTDLLEPSVVEPEPGFLAVELAAPAGARLAGAWLAVEGPDIGTLRVPGLEVFESAFDSEDEARNGGTRKEVILGGPLSPGRILEFQVPDRRLASLYGVRLIEVTGEDFSPRDPAVYSARVSR